MGNSASMSQLRDRFTHLEVPSDEAMTELFSLPTSIQDVYDAVKSEDIEELIASGSGSIFAFLTKAVSILNEPFIAPEPASNSLAKLNCLRFLTRILPVLLRHSKEPSIQKALWGEDHLAAEIADAVMGVAFLKGFTVIDSTDTEESSLIWYPGLMVPKGEISAYGVEENQTEVLRCILACCSEVIYEALEDIPEAYSPWVHLFSSTGLQHAQTLCYSLLNAVSGFKPETGLMPMLSFGVLSQEVAMLSAHLLTVFLHTQGASDEEEEKTGTEVADALQFLAQKHSVEPGSDLDSNVFIETVRSLSSEADLGLLFGAITRLLSHRRELGIEEEVLLLCWELCFHSPALTRFIAAQPGAKELYKHLLHLMWVCLDDQALAGPLQVSCFVLLLLSTERPFSVQLGAPYEGDLGVAVPQGVDTLLDVLIVATHRLTQTKNNAGLVSVLCTVISNVSNFVKRIGTLASIELVSMVKTYTQPKSLTHDLAHLQIVRSLLDTIVTRIQYYWEVRGT